jgi:hypothetical protein
LLEGRKQHAAPTLVRPPVAAGSSASPAPAPRKKKVAKKVKKKNGSGYGSAGEGAAAQAEDVDGSSQHWIDEQAKLTQMMARLYSDRAGGSDGEEAEDEDEDDVLAYYDYEAEERALQERIAELKRVSSLPGAAPSEPSSSTRPELGAEASMPPVPTCGFMRMDSPSSPSSSPPLPDSELADLSSDTLEPFCVGRRANGDFEEIEICLEDRPPASNNDGAASSSSGGAAAAGAKGGDAAAAVQTAAEAEPPLTPRSLAASASDPPLTPRSLASSIAARRAENQRMRRLPSDVRNAALMTPRGTHLTSPTGA